MDKSKRSLVFVRSIFLAFALAFLAKTLADYLAPLLPDHSALARKIIGLILVTLIGIFAVRPIFLIYMPNKKGHDRKGGDD